MKRPRPTLDKIGAFFQKVEANSPGSIVGEIKKAWKCPVAVWMLSQGAPDPLVCASTFRWNGKSEHEREKPTDEGVARFIRAIDKLKSGKPVTSDIALGLIEKIRNQK